MSILVKIKNSLFSSRSPSSRRVAILTPDTWGVARHIKDGFVQTLERNSKVPVNFETVDASSSQEHIRSLLAQIDRGRFDLVFSIGTSCTKTVARSMSAQKKDTPLVCAGITPDTLDLHGLQSVTGITADVKNRKSEYLEKLFQISPNIKHILFVTDEQNKYIIEERKLIEDVSYEHKVFVSLMNSSTFSLQRLHSFASIAFPQIDTVILNRDTHSLRIADELIMFCNEKQISLVTFDRYTVEKGASLGFGYDEKTEFGNKSAEKALLILNKSVQPTDLGLSALSHSYEISVNHESMRQQRLDIHPHVIAAMKHFEVMF